MPCLERSRPKSYACTWSRRGAQAVELMHQPAYNTATARLFLPMLAGGRAAWQQSRFPAGD
jgi:hypothetical protein